MIPPFIWLTEWRYVVIYNDSLERMEKMIEMGFQGGFTMTLAYLTELLATLSKRS